jgi:hypothetical protein
VAAPPGELARISIRLAPDPTLASSVGASWLSQVWADGAATMTSAPGALAADVASGSRRLDATPSAPSAAQMGGSHAMVYSLPSWPAIQAAACDRTVPAAEDLTGPLAGDGRWCPRPGAETRVAGTDVPVNPAMTATAAAATTSTPIAMSNARREWRRRCSRRAPHSLMVVARTGPQEGTRARVCGAAGLAVFVAVRTFLTRRAGRRRRHC